MPIKADNISPDPLKLVNVGRNMDIFFFNSQDSLGSLETSELFKEPIEQNLIEEIMKTSVNSESEELVSDVIQVDLSEIKSPQENLEGIIISPPTGIIPSQEDFTGPYGFDLNFNGPVSRGSYVYSPLLRQVFIGMNNILMMEFKTTVELDSGFYIRSLLMYTCDDFVCEPVIRCASHALEDDPRQEAHARGEEGICKCGNFNNVGHVMRCSLAKAEYCYDSQSERHSVRVPVGRLQAGTEFMQVPYSFSCKTSCPRGMQRKPVQIIFTLESEDGTVFGRKVLAIKICSCPKRDKDRQERDYKKAQQVQNVPSSSMLPKKRLATSANLSDSQQIPPIKAIKTEDSNIEDSQNEDEKQRQRKLINMTHNHLEQEHYQRLLTRISNFESVMENRFIHLENGQRECIEKLERIDCLLNDLFHNRP